MSATTFTGDLVVGAACPKCGRESVVYNGTYWCDREACLWSMSERERPAEKEIVKRYLLQRWRAYKAADDEDGMALMAAYLLAYAGRDGWL